jgi:hypothetical protein
VIHLQRRPTFVEECRSDQSRSFSPRGEQRCRQRADRRDPVRRPEADSTAPERGPPSWAFVALATMTLFNRA